MKKRELLLSSCVMLATMSCTTPKEEEKLNVIYILADDLGYGDLGCYGQDKIQTPNIDKMAEQGMLFTNHYAGCTVSAPSRCSLMTGLHTGHSQIRGNKELYPEGQQPMEEGTYTVASLMKDAGYTTGIFGKWGLGYPGSVSTPNAMGFDEFYGYNCQRQAHTYYPQHLWHNNDSVSIEENLNNGRKIFSQDLIHEQALNFIRENADTSFFAMLTYTLPHAELNLPHDSIYAMYEDKFDEVPYNGWQGYYKSDKPYASFAAMVTRLDMYVGEVINELKKLGIDKNTIVIFTSDNGPHREGGANPDYFKSYGPLKGTKRDVYDGGIRIPFIAWCPGKIAEGVKTDHISAFWDFMPTLADIANSSKELNTDGISYLPTLLSKGEQEQHKYLYWEFHEAGGRQAVRKGDWKAVVNNIKSGRKVELYNLSEDPSETNDLSESYPEKTAYMDSLMKVSHTPSESFPFPGDK